MSIFSNIKISSSNIIHCDRTEELHIFIDCGEMKLEHAVSVCEEDAKNSDMCARILAQVLESLSHKVKPIKPIAQA